MKDIRWKKNAGAGAGKFVTIILHNCNMDD